MLTRYYPALSRADLAVLLWPRRGATSAELESAITRVERGLHGIAGITITARAGEQARFGTGLVGPILIPLVVTASENSSRNLVAKVNNRLPVTAQATPRVESHVLGESALAAAVAAASKKELAAAERIGFPILLIVLLAIFGTVAAAALPILLAVATLTISGAIIYFLSLATELSTFTVNTASMFGIGVAVDYSLIVLTRLRQELRAGHSMATAQAITARTAGRAVIFSGATVVLSLAAVWVVPIVALRSMAAGAMIAVSVSVLVAITLLPALSSSLGQGRRSHTDRRRGMTARVPRVSWARWTAVVTRHPLVAIGAVCALLLPLCLPVADMKTSTGALQQLRQTDTTRIGFEQAQRIQGPGALGPIFVVVGSDKGRAQALHHAAVVAHHLAESLVDVREVGLLHLSANRLHAVFTIVPAADPESARAESLVRRLRASLGTLLTNTGVTATVGGTTASQVDEEQSIAHGMWRLVVAVLLTSFVILTVLLRSVVLPLKAIVMNLLSVGVAYGVLVIVFQWGWLDGLLQYNAPKHVYTLVPPLLLAVVFGLSMDYEVFLLARIREQWERTGKPREAIATGLAASATAISSAAFILVCVFSIFVGTGNPTIKELGVGAAVAIGIDATLIRLVLVPATMTLLGRWNWWLPKPFERVLPSWGRLSGEGTVTV